MSLSRRQFAQLLATGALSSALPASRNAEGAARAARALDEPARLDGEVLGYFHRGRWMSITGLTRCSASGG
jgi:hypothetical protein